MSPLIDLAWFDAHVRYFLEFGNYSPRTPSLNTSSHGTDGPIDTGHYRYHFKSSSVFEAGCQAVGIGQDEDMNGGGTLGVTKVWFELPLTHKVSPLMYI